MLLAVCSTSINRHKESEGLCAEAGSSRKNQIMCCVEGCAARNENEGQKDVVVRAFGQIFHHSLHNPPSDSSVSGCVESHSFVLKEKPKQNVNARYSDYLSFEME